MTNEVDDFLIHYGVKGMKWGRRKDRPEGESRFTPEQKAKIKRAAVVAGTVAIVGALAIGTAYVAKNSNAKVPPKVDSKAAEALVKEKLEDLIHATRGKERGFSLYKTGGLNSPLAEYDKAFDDQQNSTVFKRYGDNNEKVAVRFPDPDGRKDAAGRVIPHEIILPEALSKGVTNLDEAVAKVWPMVRDNVEARYNDPRYGPIS
ncbi:hypothetical protein SEA_NIGHTMARE_8 [Arthrobacter phage Nightmare]|uniref:Uncharacterized protein n=1 Tax=Arthrobacter phage Nightmare TaxID=2015864 RepID=A0A221J6F3_9CAUD|nr:hypothetical protein QCN33_gp08 [Arthrobacter phage Nightmare]ASM62284.1 hypothetical protein SEA_NIGHTMARE_8 [Arthrobacter phage Nightmare]